MLAPDGLVARTDYGGRQYLFDLQGSVCQRLDGSGGGIRRPLTDERAGENIYELLGRGYGDEMWNSLKGLQWVLKARKLR